MATISDVEVGRVVGTSVKRKEDLRLLTGRKRFVDDIDLPGMVWMAVVRSPYAHARIGGVDLSAAREAPGIIAAWSGEDLAAEWSGPLPMAWPVTEDINVSSHWPLTKDKARYVGDGVAVVVAETREQAADAAALVTVDYEPLPVVVDPEQALADGAPLVHDEFGTKKCYTWPLAAGDVDGRVRERCGHREGAVPPAAPDPERDGAARRRRAARPGHGRVTLFTSTQIPHIARVTLTGTLGMSETKLRVVAPDVGGGFGSKLDVYAEEALALALARRLARPVKWIETRSENYLATIHGRDVVQEIELAADEEGPVTAVRAKLIASMGAYLQLITPGIPLLGAWLYAGAYAPRRTASSARASSRTRRRPTRTAGPAGRRRPTRSSGRWTHSRGSSTWIRSSCAAGTSSGSSRTRSRSGLTVDSGDYDAHLDRALELVDYEALRTRASRAARRGRHEAARHRLLDVPRDVRARAVAHPRRAALRRRRLGRGRRALPADRHGGARIGTTPHGQGHVTSLQIVAERLGLEVDEDRGALRRRDRAAGAWTPTAAAASPIGGTAVWNA